MVCASGIVLTGCAVQETVDNVVIPAVETAGDVAIGTGDPRAAIVGLGAIAITSLYKWFRHSKNTREVVTSVEAGLNKLTPHQKKAMLGEVAKVMPDSVKKTVKTIRATL